MDTPGFALEPSGSVSTNLVHRTLTDALMFRVAKLTHRPLINAPRFRVYQVGTPDLD